jgi:glycerol-3-phosphate acyltransferase PlsY
MQYFSLILAYLFGSVSFAIMVSRTFKLDDPRTYGSQNAGATNVMRSGNKLAAGLTLLGDMLKGLIVVLVAKHYFGQMENGQPIVALCGIMVILGHIYPIFFNFKGGKGVATAVGVMLGFNIWLAVLLLITWSIAFKLSKTSSLSALLATLLAPVYAYLLLGNNAYFGATLVIAFFVLYKHKANIIRLLSGQEHNFKNPQP